jgi:two-component system chemotaxis response regulator CheB
MWPANKKIRVLVVDDSVVARTMISRGLSACPQLEVVGMSFNARDARGKIDELRPDVMTLDVEMPGMNGIDFLKELLPQYPLPVILVSALSLKVFEALSTGAVDFVRKPEPGQNEAFIAALTQKVRDAAGAKVRHFVSAPPSRRDPLSESLGWMPSVEQVIIGIGASTGGTEATLEILKRLPADVPGILIVQHMPTGFTQMYAERLNRLCQMEVREAKHRDEIRPGLALVAPADLQMRVVRVGSRYTVACTQDEKISGHRPSVDVLFHSMAEQVQCKMVGIILTGMGRDGADGLLQMRKKGAFTIGQDKETSVVYGMPMVAYNIGAVQTQASCENIAGVLLRQLKQPS